MLQISSDVSCPQHSDIQHRLELLRPYHLHHLRGRVDDQDLGSQRNVTFVPPVFFCGQSYLGCYARKLRLHLLRY